MKLGSGCRPGFVRHAKTAPDDRHTHKQDVGVLDSNIQGRPQGQAQVSHFGTGETGRGGKRVGTESRAQGVCAVEEEACRYC